jgi:glycosyltransferase involved in cell wall biosynthesis
VIVVNDGSSDPRVREILDGYRDARLRVIHQDNAGFVQAIRRAIAASQAPFIAIQGAGDVSHPQRLARQYAFLAAHPEVAMAGCRYHNVTKRAGSDDVRRLGKCRNPEPTAAEIRRGNPFAHGEVMIRRACYDAVGGYRTFFVNSQDKDLWLRLSMTLPPAHHRRGALRAPDFCRRRDCGQPEEDARPDCLFARRRPLSR